MSAGTVGIEGRSTSVLDLLQTAEQVGQMGSWEWLPGLDVRVWSDNLYRLFGLEPGQIAPSREFFVEQTHPDDRHRLTRFMESSRRLSRPPPIEIRILHPRRGVRRLRGTIAKVDWDGHRATRIVGVIQDVTDEHLTRREIAAHLAVSKLLAEWDKHPDGLLALLGELGSTFEFALGALWLPQGHVLVPEVVWSGPMLEPAELEAAAAALRSPLGLALSGRVWRSKRPQTVPDPAHNGATQRQLIASQPDLLGAIAFPALHSDEVVAVFEFHHDQDPEQIERLRPTMVAFGYELGEFLSRRGGQLGAAHLTARQHAVLELAAAGNTTPQIAAELDLSSTTVRTHFDHIYEKLGVADRSAAIAQGIRLGLIR